MKIYHVLPGNCPQLVPHMIQAFMANCEQMGTKLEDHRFVILGTVAADTRAVYEGLGVAAGQLVFMEGRLGELVRLFRRLDRGALLVLHSIFWASIWRALALRPGLWRRTVWLMWGADVHALCGPIEHNTWLRSLYGYLRRAPGLLLRKIIIRRLGAVAALAPGDFNVLQSRFGKLDNYHRVFYSDTVLTSETEKSEEPRADGGLRVCLGNSASESNCHVEALQWLSRFKHENITIICPLSYGDPCYADAVVAAGRDLLGDKFQPLLELLEREAWVKLLKAQDILVFNHKRQQGLFALYTMLFAGKKCFVRSDISVHAMLREFGIQTFPTETIASLPFAEFARPLQPELAEANRGQCQQHLSKEASVASWRQLFARFLEAT
jgi:dTDP-N-acetylfucosamine:lipid II N-acetylfucosaminyltransferase